MAVNAEKTRRNMKKWRNRSSHVGSSSKNAPGSIE